MSKPENTTLMFTHGRGFSTSDGRAVTPQAREGAHGWPQEMATGRQRRRVVSRFFADVDSDLAERKGPAVRPGQC